MSLKKVGLIVNPIAGMGGRVGLKGTDGMVEKAIELGATPVSGERALQALTQLRDAKRLYNEQLPIHFYTCSGDMGERWLKGAGFGTEDYEVVFACKKKTTASDTATACERFLELKKEKGLDLILFCGGDGTARDIFNVVKKDVPILGIPAGVKMHSGVFGVNVASITGLLIDFVNDRIGTNDVEVIDLDEELYRKGEWKLRLYGIARTPFESNYIQGGKMLIEEVSEEDVKQEIASHIIELMERSPKTIFLLGAGTTVEGITKRLGLEKTLLGIDAVQGKKVIASDLNEQGFLELLSKHRDVKLVLSPIGAQGFILGRGNLQISPAVIRKIGIANIIVISTPSKLMHTPTLRVDTGDEELDGEFKKRNLFVINGYHSVCLRPVG